MADASLKPDPNRKGSYYRRIEDIDRALKSLEVTKLPPAPQFITYFFACEKLAHGIVGIHNARPATEQYNHRNRLRLTDLKTASTALGLRVQLLDLDCLFAEYNEQHLLHAAGTVRTSARLLRNKLTHEFGPTNAEKILRQSGVLIPKMIAFLSCIPHVLAYQRARFADVP